MIAATSAARSNHMASTAATSILALSAVPACSTPTGRKPSSLTTAARLAGPIPLTRLRLHSRRAEFVALSGSLAPPGGITSKAGPSPVAPWPQQPEPTCAATCLSPSSGFIRPFPVKGRSLRTSAAVATPAPATPTSRRSPVVTPAPGAPLFALPAASIPLRSALNTMPLVQGGLVLGSPPLAPPPSGSKAPRTGRTPQQCPAINSKHNQRNAGRKTPWLHARLRR